jgi:hypothetical protein
VHNNSHHTSKAKIATAESIYIYNIAKVISCNNDNKEYSRQMIDGLLLNNGYASRVLENLKRDGNGKRYRPTRKTTG